MAPRDLRRTVIVPDLPRAPTRSASSAATSGAGGDFGEDFGFDDGEIGHECLL